MRTIPEWFTTVITNQIHCCCIQRSSWFTSSVSFSHGDINFFRRACLCVKTVKFGVIRVTWPQGKNIRAMPFKSEAIFQNQRSAASVVLLYWCVVTERNKHDREPVILLVDLCSCPCMWPQAIRDQRIRSEWIKRAVSEGCLDSAVPTVSQLWWFRRLTRMPPGWLPAEVFGHLLHRRDSSTWDCLSDTWGTVAKKHSLSKWTIHWF